jgi:hypothetical protein
MVMRDLYYATLIAGYLEDMVAARPLPNITVRAELERAFEDRRGDWTRI